MPFVLRYPLVHYPKENLSDNDCWYHAAVMLLGYPPGPNAPVSTEGVKINADGGLDSHAANIFAFGHANGLRAFQVRNFHEAAIYELRRVLISGPVMIIGSKVLPSAHAFVVAGVEIMGNRVWRFDSDLPSARWMDWPTMMREWQLLTCYMLLR